MFMLGMDFKELVKKIQKAAKSKKALYVLASVCLLEPLMLPMFPEVILAPLLLSRPGERLKTLCLALSMTLLGSSLSYCISYFFGTFILSGLGSIIPNIKQIIENMSTYGYYLPLLGSFLPMPFKIVCLSSGLLKISFMYFLSGIFVGRLGRYSLLLMIPRRPEKTKSEQLPSI